MIRVPLGRSTISPPSSFIIAGPPAKLSVPPANLGILSPPKVAPPIPGTPSGTVKLIEFILSIILFILDLIPFKTLLTMSFKLVKCSGRY